MCDALRHGDNMTWSDYWNGATTVYANARHKSVHYDVVAREFEAYLQVPGARVVDYGCGEALSAHRVADGCAQLWLCDGATRVRYSLYERYANRQDIEIISPRLFEQLPSGTVDLIVVNSVIQYLSMAEFVRFLAVARGKLSARGHLVLADVLPRQLGAHLDASELLKFAKKNGFLLSAVGGLARSFFSSYRTTRSQCGLLRLDEAEMLGVLAQAGFIGRRRLRNFGHNNHRMTFEAVLQNPQEIAICASQQPNIIAFIRPARSA